MELLDLLDRARQAGLSLTLDGSLIRATGPAEAVPIVEELKPFKSELVRRLSWTREPREFWRDPRVCIECGRPLLEQRRYCCPDCSELWAACHRN